MNLEHAVRVIGALHLLQPPLALLLIRRIELGRALSSCPPLVEQVARNMAVASIALPTTLGVLLAVHAAEVATGGPARSLAWVVAAFWSWRLARQCWARGAWRGPSGGSFHSLLSLIFLVQGPGLALLLAFASLTR